MTNAELRIIQLEQLTRRQQIVLGALQNQVATLQQTFRTQQPTTIFSSNGGSNSSLSGGIPGISDGSGVPSIGAGDTVSGIPIYDSNGNLIDPSGTVYNPFDVPTIGGLPLSLVANPDGTWTLMGESC